MVDTQQLQDMGEQQLRELASTLIAQIAHRDQAIIERDHPSSTPTLLSP